MLKRDVKLQLTISVLLMWLGVFDDGFWNVTVEYAKNSSCDLLCRYTVCNQSNQPAVIHVLPTLWFRSDDIQCLFASQMYSLQHAVMRIN